MKSSTVDSHNDMGQFHHLQADPGFLEEEVGFDF